MKKFTKLSSKNVLDLLAKLAYADCKDWFTLTSAAKFLGVSPAKMWEIVKMVAPEGYLEIQDGWDDGEKLRFRLSKTLLNNYHRKQFYS